MKSELLQTNTFIYKTINCVQSFNQHYVSSISILLKTYVKQHLLELIKLEY